VLYLALKTIEKNGPCRLGMEADVATIRDHIRRQNAITVNYQQNLRSSIKIKDVNCHEFL
jgi:hypothetical protein